MSLIISFLLWFFTRKWRRERKKNKLEKEIRKYEDDDDFKSQTSFSIKFLKTPHIW